MVHTYRNAWAALILIIMLLLSATGRVAHAAPELTVGNYQLISTTRIGRTESEYTYKAAITNTGSDASNVTATLSIDVPGVTVINNQLNFGDIQTGNTLESSNTFSIRHDRLYSFRADDLQWTIHATPKLSPPTNPETVEIGNGESPLTINTLLYEGNIEVTHAK